MFKKNLLGNITHVYFYLNNNKLAYKLAFLYFIIMQNVLTIWNKKKVAFFLGPSQLKKE